MEENKYKDALERAREIYFNKEYKPNEAALVKEILTGLFPELRESEDENVRKEIISALKNANYKNIYDKHIAWLEKLKDFDEQLEQAYKNSDEVQYKRGYDDGYVEGMVAAKQELEKQGTIKDGNSIDPHFGKHIITDCGAKEKIQEKIIELSHEEAQVWSEEDDKILCGVIDEIQANKSSAPEYDLKTYDKFLSWLKSIKDRVLPKSTWSENDEENLHLVLEGFTIGQLGVAYCKVREWLDSIKKRLS